MTEAGAAQLTAHRRSLDALTGVRLCASVYVVIYHSKLGPKLADHGHWLIANFFSNGDQSVELFFQLSGFILAYTYARRMTDWSSYRRFWEARFARIWPVYVVSLLMISALEGNWPKPAHIITALFMVQSWDPFNFGLAGIWNVVCWTLSCEAFFYLVFPWFQRFIEKLSGRNQLLLLGTFLTVTVSLNLSRNGVGWTTDAFNVQWVPLAVQRLPEFLAGVTLGNYFHGTTLREQRGYGAGNAGRGWLTYVAAVMGVAVLCHYHGRWTSLIVVPSSMFIFGLATEKTMISKLLSTRVMLFGGAISYSMYLIQTSVKDIAKWMGPRIHIYSEAALSVLMFVLLVLISAALFEGVEKPMRDKIRSFFARRERSSSEAAAS